MGRLFFLACSPRRDGIECHDEKEIALGIDVGRFRADHRLGFLGIPQIKPSLGAVVGGSESAWERLYRAWQGLPGRGAGEWAGQGSDRRVLKRWVCC